MTDGTEGQSDDENRRERERKWKRERQPLDHSPSSGPIGSEQKSFDETAPTSHDGRAETRTIFYANEGNNSVNYDKLAKINDGLFSPDADKHSGRADRRRDMEIFTNEVSFTDLETGRAFQLLSQVDDARKYQSDEVLVLSIITFVANENERRIRSEDAFKDLRHQCNVSKKNIRKARQKLRENL